MRISWKILSTSWRFLPNPERRIYKNKKEAFRDFCKVSGADLLWRVALALILVEFGFPTPDVVYDLKRIISPDFDAFCKHGELAEYDLRLDNRLRGMKKEEKKYYYDGVNAKSPESRFGGII